MCLYISSPSQCTAQVGGAQRSPVPFVHNVAHTNPDIHTDGRTLPNIISLTSQLMIMKSLDIKEIILITSPSALNQEDQVVTVRIILLPTRLSYK